MRKKILVLESPTRFLDGVSERRKDTKLELLLRVITGDIQERTPR